MAKSSPVPFLNRLFFKMSVLFSLVIILVFTAGFWVSTRYARRALEAELDRRLWTLSSLASRILSEDLLLKLKPGDEDSEIYRLLHEKVQEFLNLSKAERLLVVDKDSKILFDSEGHLPIGSREALLALDSLELGHVWKGKAMGSILYEGPGGGFYKSYYYPLRGGDGKIFSAVALEAGADFLKEISQMKVQMERIALLGILLTCLVCSLFAIGLVRPIEKLMRGMLRARLEGRLEKVQVERKDEIGYLARIFDDMVEVLAQKDLELKRLYEEEKKKAEHIKGFNDYLLDGMGSGVMGVDLEGCLSTWNRSASSILEKRNVQLGQPYHQVLGRGHPLAECIEEVRQTHRAIERKEILLKGDERGEKLIGASVSPFDDAQGNFLGVTAIFSDITRIRQLERELKVKERLAVVGQLTAGLAHEIKNPLGALKGFIGLLKRAFPESADKMLLDQMDREVESLNRIVTDFLSFARSPQLNKVEVDLKNLLEEALVTTLGPRPPGDLTVLRDFPADRIQLLADPGELKKALVNLMKNAIQAMQGKGRLRICAGRGAGECQLAIQDTGPGIAAEFLDRIFDPFFTTKEDGTGLGLSITHKIIEAHGGRIEIKSELGKGTTVDLVLPIK